MHRSCHRHYNCRHERRFFQLLLLLWVVVIDQPVTGLSLNGKTGNGENAIVHPRASLSHSRSVKAASQNLIESSTVSDIVPIQKQTRQQQGQPTLYHERRNFLFQVSSVFASTGVVVGSMFDVTKPAWAVTTTIASSSSSSSKNPLNLKGSFWETGELYDKSKQVPISYDPNDIIVYLQVQIKTLKSLQDTLILEGDYSQLLKLLRGGAISETQLRKQSYALLDQLDDETINKDAYLASDALRTFFNSWDNLDRTVDGASKQSITGVANTIGLAVLSPYNAANQVARITSTSPTTTQTDTTLLVLNALEETTKNLERFVTLSRKALP